MSAPHLSRAHDEEVLLALRLRCEGRTWRYVAEVVGRSIGSIQRSCVAVRQHDEAYTRQKLEGAY